LTGVVTKLNFFCTHVLYPLELIEIGLQAAPVRQMSQGEGLALDHTHDLFFTHDEKLLTIDLHLLRTI
jgi:hypothetical protein